MKPFRLVGFEDLGNVDGFDTAALELRLLQSGRYFVSGPLNKSANRLLLDVISNKKNSLQPLFKVASARNLEDDEVFDL
jgi:hypothetical protein